MAARGSQLPRGFSAVAPNRPAGSAAPHSERTRVSADVPDRPKPSTNRATGLAAVRLLVVMASATLHVMNWSDAMNSRAVAGGSAESIDVRGGWSVPVRIRSDRGSLKGSASKDAVRQDDRL